MNDDVDLLVESCRLNPDDRVCRGVLADYLEETDQAEEVVLAALRNWDATPAVVTRTAGGGVRAASKSSSLSREMWLATPTGRVVSASWGTLAGGGTAAFFEAFGDDGLSPAEDAEVRGVIGHLIDILGDVFAADCEPNDYLSMRPGCDTLIAAARCTAGTAAVGDLPPSLHDRDRRHRVMSFAVRLAQWAGLTCEDRVANHTTSPIF